MKGEGERWRWMREVQSWKTFEQRSCSKSPKHIFDRVKVTCKNLLKKEKHQNGLLPHTVTWKTSDEVRTQWKWFGGTHCNKQRLNKAGYGTPSIKSTREKEKRSTWRRELDWNIWNRLKGLIKNRVRRWKHVSGYSWA